MEISSFSINCKIKPDLPWSIEIPIIAVLPGNPDANPPVSDMAAIQTTSATFQINNAKLYGPVVTLTVNENIKLLEYISQGFKRTISWKKYRSEITTKPKNNNLDYLIDPTFSNSEIFFLNSRFIFGLMFGIQGNLFRLV